MPLLAVKMIFQLLFVALVAQECLLKGVSCFPVTRDSADGAGTTGGGETEPTSPGELTERATQESVDTAGELICQTTVKVQAWVGGYYFTELTNELGSPNIWTYLRGRVQCDVQLLFDSTCDTPSKNLSIQQLHLKNCNTCTVGNYLHTATL